MSSLPERHYILDVLQDEAGKESGIYIQKY